MKKISSENELILGMLSNLSHNNIDSINLLTKAADHLNSAITLLEDLGLHKKANKVLNILEKIANDSNNFQIKEDPHVKGLTPDKMVKNLLHHGTEFNMSDDKSYDILNADIDEEDDLIIEDNDFEDE